MMEQENNEPKAEDNIVADAVKQVEKDMKEILDDIEL
jgi:hypothetical protein